MADFSLDSFDWAGLASQLAGAAIQRRATNKALDRQKQAIDAARAQQLQAQDQASQVAARAAAQYAPQTRQAAQQQIAQQLTGELNQQVPANPITAQGVQVGATIPDAAGGSDYLAAKAREQVKSTESLRALAAMMGRIGSATELRRGEAVGMGDASQEIGRINTGAGNLFEAAKPGIETAGGVSLAPMLAGEALRQYGGSRMMMNGVRPKPIDFSGYGAPSGATGGWV